MQGLLQTTSKYTPANSQLDLPAIVVQITSGVGVYIIWAGTTNAGGIDPVSNGGLNQNSESGGMSDGMSMDPILQQGRLGADWACSMGSRNPSIPLSGTTLLRSTTEPVAFAMSQRLGMNRLILDSPTTPSDGKHGGFWPETLVDTNRLTLPQSLAAQRFKSQIYLSVDLNPSHITGGRGPAVALAVERAVLEVLKGLVEMK